MTLVEDNGIVGKEEIVANIMNNYFSNITTHLKLKPTKIDPRANLESITDTFKNHESVQRIKLKQLKNYYDYYGAHASLFMFEFDSHQVCYVCCYVMSD